MTKRILSPEAIEKMRQGGRNRAKAFTSQYQKETRKQLPKEVCVRGGKASYQQLEKKFGKEYCQDKAADWRRSKGGSSLDRKVAQWLPEGFEAEVKIKHGDKWFYVDFLVNSNIVIEVNGEFAHRNRSEFDAYKYQTLADWGYTVIILPEADIKSGQAEALLNKLFKAN